MKRISANRSFRLHRLARLEGWLRMLACVLAFSLAVGGYVAAAAPLHGARAMTMGHDGGDCGRHAGKAKHAGGDCCRVACACALGHAIADPPPSACVGVFVAAMPPIIGDDAVHATRVEPPLRPPIA